MVRSVKKKKKISQTSKYLALKKQCITLCLSHKCHFLVMSWIGCFLKASHEWRVKRCWVVREEVYSSYYKHKNRWKISSFCDAEPALDFILYWIWIRLHSEVSQEPYENTILKGTTQSEHSESGAFQWDTFHHEGIQSCKDLLALHNKSRQNKNRESSDSCPRSAFSQVWYSYLNFYNTYKGWSVKETDDSTSDQCWLYVTFHVFILWSSFTLKAGLSFKETSIITFNEGTVKTLETSFLKLTVSDFYHSSKLSKCNMIQCHHHLFTISNIYNIVTHLLSIVKLRAKISLHYSETRYVRFYKCWEDEKMPSFRIPQICWIWE